MEESTRVESERRTPLTALSTQETERKLDAIGREAGQLRESLEAMRAQSALTGIQEMRLSETAALMERLCDETVPQRRDRRSVPQA